MIEKEKIVSWVTQQIEGTELFIVEISVGTDNNIVVVVDSPKGVTITNCIEISKFIESNLNREEEDFELQVFSAGLGQPLRVEQQYTINVGKKVELVLFNGKKITGKLMTFDKSLLTIEEQKMEKVEGKKRKQLITNIIQYNLQEIKTTKVVISFK